jgi:glucose-1-phosphate adenylyltransferase
MLDRTQAVILAGGKGTRLEPLTRDRAKPAVPFGGAYRIVDFTLSNCLNSGLHRILVLTQYKAASLHRHVTLFWQRYFCRERGEYVDIAPPQQQVHENWYQGTADAVYQNLPAIEKERPEYVVILAGDHVYKMNYQPFVEYHIQKRADLTIGALPVMRAEAARQFGVLEVDRDDRVTGFQEKPADPKPVPGDNLRCLASMGIYVATVRFLFETLGQDARQRDSGHDFGSDVIPMIMEDHQVFAYPFQNGGGAETAYWRDVGTLDAFYEANLDLVSSNPQLNLYDEAWPIRAYHPDCPAARFLSLNGDRRGAVWQSIVGPGSIILGGQVERSIVGRQCCLDSGVQVEGSILFDRVRVARGARLQRVIVEKGVNLPPGVAIGFDPDLDQARGFTRSEGGVTVVPRDAAASPSVMEGR